MMIPNSFGLQARAKNCILINSLDDLSLLETIDDEILIIGAGTNVILNDYFDGTVIMVNMQEIEKVNGFISVGAGVSWADLIEYCLLNEALWHRKSYTYSRICRRSSCSKYWSLWC